MTQIVNELKLDAIAAQAQASLQQAAMRLQQALGKDLLSMTVVGSAATEAYRQGVSDINTVLVLKDLTRAQLDAIATQAKSLHKLNMGPPLLMTPEYIERSHDVFSVELLDFQHFGATIWGEDPFSRLTFKKTHVRLQCERELKAMLIRLRQGYIAAAGNKKLLQDLLVATAKASLPYLRAMLWIKDQPREAGVKTIVTNAGEALKLDIHVLADIMDRHYAKVRVQGDQMMYHFEKTYTAIEKLARWVDRFEV